MSFLKNIFGKKPKETESSENNAQAPRAASTSQQESKATRILPRIKVDYSHPIYQGDQDKRFTGNPLPKGMEIPHDQLPIIKPLYEDLLVSFAIDKGTNYELLQNHILTKKPNLTPESLLEMSKHALIAEIGNAIKLNGDPSDMVMVTAGGNFEASIILLDDFWNQMHDIFKDDLVIALPARDLLLVCKETNTNARLKMRGIVENFFTKEGTQGLLSKGLYLRKKDVPNLELVEQAF